MSVGAAGSDAPRSRRRALLVSLAAAGLVVATAGILLAMGRAPICPCGVVRLWEGDAFGPGNSQHLTDWYTPSHLIHGFIFFALARAAVGPRAIGVRLLMALAVEAAWEIVENSPAIIERYRAATVSLHYAGDSVLNSVSDIAAMTVGFALAARLPVAATIALAVVFELLTGALVRDNLTLNVVMLLHPVEWIRAWQSAL